MTTETKKDAVITPIFRVSFPSLFTPNDYDENKKYEVTALFKKSDRAEWNKILGLVEPAAMEKWGKKPAQIQLWNSPLCDGDAKADASEEGKYEDYRGCYYLTFRSQYAPGIVDKARQDILDSEEVYPGCYGRALVNVHAWEFKHKKTGAVMKRGVSFGLQHFQKLEDGERIGGTRGSAADAFSDGSDTATEAEFDV